MEDRGIGPRAPGIGNLSGIPASPMNERQKEPKAAKAGKQGKKPPVSHRENFESLLDLAAKGEKPDNLKGPEPGKPGSRPD